MDLLKKHLREVVDKTWNHAGRCATKRDEINNALLGLVGETGEVADVFKKFWFHKEKDRRDELVEEFGDVLYYLPKLMELTGVTIEEALEANKKKLFKRYEVDGKRS